MLLLAVGKAVANDPPQPSSPEPLPEAAGTSIEYDSPHAALEALKAKPGVEIRSKQGWTIVNDEATRTLWTFTPEGHPAHPSAVKRSVLFRDGALYLDLNVRCLSTKTACDNLVREFQALNDRVRSQMQDPKP
jgi:hypothetical protein